MRSSEKTPYFSGLRRIKAKAGYCREYFVAVGKAIKHRRFYAVFVDGKESHSGESVKALYIGNRLDHRLIFKQIFSDFVVREIKENISIFGAIQLARKCEEEVDIIFMDFEYVYGKFVKLCKMNFVYMPKYIGQKLAIGKSLPDLLSYLSKHRDPKFINRIFKNNVTYRLVDAEEYFKDFYKNYYLPFTRKKFGDTALIEDEDVFLHMCRKGKVMQIIHANEVKLYNLMQLKQGRMTLHWLGVKENIDDKLYSVLINASYYYQFLYAFEQGCDHVDLLYARPLLNDGVYGYKRCWGTYVYPVSDLMGGLFVKPANFSGPIAKIFSNNYFVTRQNDKLMAKILFENGDLSIDWIGKFMKVYYSKGIDAVKIYSLQKVDPDVAAWVLENAPPVQLIDLSNEKEPQEVFCR